MSQNKYADMTISMKAFTQKALAEAEREVFKFKRYGQMPNAIPVYELEAIVRIAEIRALREVMEAIKSQPYESDEARFAAFAKLREDYTESGKARYMIEHGVPEDTSAGVSADAQRNALAALGGYKARHTVEAITYDVLTGIKKDRGA